MSKKVAKQSKKGAAFIAVLLVVVIALTATLGYLTNWFRVWGKGAGIAGTPNEDCEGGMIVVGTGSERMSLSVKPVEEKSRTAAPLAESGKGGGVVTSDSYTITATVMMDNGEPAPEEWQSVEFSIGWVDPTFDTINEISEYVSFTAENSTATVTYLKTFFNSIAIDVVSTVDSSITGVANVECLRPIQSSIVVLRNGNETLHSVPFEIWRDFRITYAWNNSYGSIDGDYLTVNSAKLDIYSGTKDCYSLLDSSPYLRLARESYSGDITVSGTGKTITTLVNLRDVNYQTDGSGSPYIEGKIYFSIGEFFSFSGESYEQLKTTNPECVKYLQWAVQDALTGFNKKTADHDTVQVTFYCDCVIYGTTINDYAKLYTATNSVGASSSYYVNKLNFSELNPVPAMDGVDTDRDTIVFNPTT